MSVSSVEVQAGVEALLTVLCPDLPDADVREYLAAGLAEDDDPEADDYSDSLAGFSASFGARPPAEQLQMVRGLLQRVAAVKAEARPQHTVAAACTNAPAAAAVPQTLFRLGGCSVGRSSGIVGSSSGCSSDEDGERAGHAGPSGGAQHVVLCMLRELCAVPEASDAFLAHLLSSKGGGDVEAAATWMLECPDLPAAQAAWQQERQRRREERQRAAAEQEAVRKQIVNRFHLQAVPECSGSKGKGKPATIKAWGADGKGKGGSSGEGKVRFREGQVATRAGQKYVVETVGEEWDGGSRGKVMTKGKRGKGFV